MNPIKMSVNKIIGEPVNGYSRVTLSYALFQAVKGSNPVISTYTRESAGVRKFVIDGVVVYSHFTVDAVTKRASTTFIMRTEDAVKYLVTPTASTLPFAISSFIPAVA